MNNSKYEAVRACITETISLLDELRAGAIQDRVNEWKTNLYSAKLHDAYEALRQAALDGERYRKGAKILEDYLLSGTLPEDDCAALTLYRQAVEQKEV